MSDMNNTFNDLIKQNHDLKMTKTEQQQNNSFADIIGQQIQENQKFEMDLTKAIECQVHLGSDIKKVHESMKQYLYPGEIEGLSLINLDITKQIIEEGVFPIIQNTIASGKNVLIIGKMTNHNHIHNKENKAQNIAYNQQFNNVIVEFANECGALYIIDKMLPGTLTNNKQVVENSKTRLTAYQKKECANSAEKSSIALKCKKIEKNIVGLRDSKPIGAIIIINDGAKSHDIIKEALLAKGNMIVIGLSDTNVNEGSLHYNIPCNTSNVGSVAYILKSIKSAFINGHNEFLKKKAAKTTDNNYSSYK